MKDLNNTIAVLGIKKKSYQKLIKPRQNGQLYDAFAESEIAGRKIKKCDQMTEECKKRIGVLRKSISQTVLIKGGFTRKKNKK